MEHLLLISLECRGVALVMRAIWATTEDRLTGRRRTDTELLVDAPALLQRLAELVPQLAPPAGAVQGVAAMVSAANLALAAGGDGGPREPISRGAAAGARLVKPGRRRCSRRRNSRLLGRLQP